MVEYSLARRYTPIMLNKPVIHPTLKLVLDFGPLIAFFAANARFGIFAATGAVMVAAVLALCVSYGLTRKMPIMPVITAVLVLVLGSLTLILQDETFIKIKPTVVYMLFGGVLIGGLALRKPLLGMVLDSMLQLTDEGWRKLTVRWAAFFFGLAVLNEIVWRTQTTDVWVYFKVFGATLLTVLFMAFQYPLLTRHSLPEPAKQE